MKRFLAIVSVIMMVLISGCKKEEQSLAGTKWEIDGGNESVTLSFTSIKASLSYQGGSTYFYSYEYDDPTVIMHPEASDRAVLKGIIKDNQMTLINTNTDETVGFFNKQ